MQPLRVVVWCDAVSRWHRSKACAHHDGCEKPWDQENQEGLPFVGPAGKLLGDALHEMGVAREHV